MHLTSNAGEKQLRPRDLLVLTHFAEQMCIVEASQMKEAGLCYERMLLWIGQTMGETIPKTIIRIFAAELNSTRILT